MILTTASQPPTFSLIEKTTPDVPEPTLVCTIFFTALMNSGCVMILWRMLSSACGTSLGLIDLDSYNKYLSCIKTQCQHDLHVHQQCLGPLCQQKTVRHPANSHNLLVNHFYQDSRTYSSRTCNNAIICASRVD
jgi:hypothetical protein